MHKVCPEKKCAHLKSDDVSKLFFWMDIGIWVATNYHTKRGVGSHRKNLNTRFEKALFNYWMVFLKNVNLAMGGALVLAGSIKPIALRECVIHPHSC